MILGIDAFNIRAGGGVTHLAELLRVAEPSAYGFREVVVWGSSSTLSKIDSRDWLRKVEEPLLNRGLLSRIYWQKFKLKILAKRAGCDLLFSPGGSDASGFRPIVSMSQNLLPFEWRELRRYGCSLLTLKFLLLALVQTISFRHADGVIFLTRYAQDRVLRLTGKLKGETIIISHGINPRFSMQPRVQRFSTQFTGNNPCNILYVSAVDVYKHQWVLARAIAELRSEGFSVVLDLVGPAAAGIGKLNDVLLDLDPSQNFIFYHGAIPYENLNYRYLKADIFVFASSCETFGQILTEAMSAGLPIACSCKSAMPEILCDAGIYFNPEDVNDVKKAIRDLMESSNLREGLAWQAFSRSTAYSWNRCANETFLFLSNIARKHKRQGGL